MTNRRSTFQPHGLRSLRAYQLARQLAHMVYEANGSWDRTYALREQADLYDA